MNKQVRKYFRDCKMLFPSYGKEERNFLNKLKDNLDANELEMSYDEIVDRLGQPKDVIVSYYEEKDSMYLIKKAKLAHFVRAILVCALVAMIAFFSARLYIFEQEYKVIRESTDGYFEEIIE